MEAVSRQSQGFILAHPSLHWSPGVWLWVASRELHLAAANAWGQLGRDVGQHPHGGDCCHPTLCHPPPEELRLWDWRGRFLCWITLLGTHHLAGFPPTPNPHFSLESPMELWGCGGTEKPFP